MLTLSVMIFTEMLTSVFKIDCNIQSQSCGWQDFKCGDICIPKFKSCYLGAEKVEYNYNYNYKYLLGSQNDNCYQENGNGFCINGRRVQQIDDDILQNAKIEQSRVLKDKKTCTNPGYFNCTKSGKCVHPSLVCDGHPQCEHKGTATLRCSSIMHNVSK
jgi:hypothetical protein